MNYSVMVVSLKGDITKEKNKALKEFLKTKKNSLFLIEENVEVKDTSIFQKFIDASDATGIEVLMYARPEMNKRLEFNEDKYINYWTDFNPSFVLYTRNAIKECGLMDEKMPPNTWQDLEYIKRIGDKGLSTPFGMFASPKINNMLEFKKVDNYKNVKQLDEALEYWANMDSDFPINLVKEKEKIQETAPITEMI